MTSTSDLREIGEWCEAIRSIEMTDVDRCRGHVVADGFNAG